MKHIWLSRSRACGQNPWLGLQFVVFNVPVKKKKKLGYGGQKQKTSWNGSQSSKWDSFDKKEHFFNSKETKEIEEEKKEKKRQKKKNSFC